MIKAVKKGKLIKRDSAIFNRLVRKAFSKKVMIFFWGGAQTSIHMGHPWAQGLWKLGRSPQVASSARCPADALPGSQDRGLGGKKELAHSRAVPCSGLGGGEASFGFNFPTGCWKALGWCLKFSA